MRQEIFYGAIFALSSLSLNAVSFAQDALPKANIEAIFDVGVEEEIGRDVDIVEGTYVVGPISGSEIVIEHYLMVENDANDPDSFFALMIPRPLADKATVGTGRFYHGRRLIGSRSMMLSPLHVDLTGNLQITSENQRDAPVLEVTMRPGRSKYPFIVKGRNGALGNQILGMRGHNFKRPTLKAKPQDGIFVSGSARSPEVIVNYPEISFYESTNRDNSFTIVDLNGEDGKFASLLRSQLDTIAEANVADEKISRIAMFVNGGCFDSEVLIVLNPKNSLPGEFNVRLYRPSARSAWEIIFPGRRKPRQ